MLDIPSVRTLEHQLTLSVFNHPKLGRDGRTSEVFGDPSESKPEEVQMAKALTSSKTASWVESYTKLLAFSQTDYERILRVEFDSTVSPNMDELFIIGLAFVQAKDLLATTAS